MALTPAEKMRRRRAKLKGEGRCQKCGHRKGPRISVCRSCNEYAKSKVRESRSAS